MKVSLSRAIEGVLSNQRVFVHGGAATPTALLGELVRQAERLSNVDLFNLFVGVTSVASSAIALFNPMAFGI